MTLKPRITYHDILSKFLIELISVNILDMYRIMTKANPTIAIPLYVASNVKHETNKGTFLNPICFHGAFEFNDLK